MNSHATNKHSMVRHFSPAWYASVMGTGGLAMVMDRLSGLAPFTRPVGSALAILNTALFLVLIGPWLARWFFHFDQLLKDLRHPIMSNFFVTMPVGGLILAMNFFIFGRQMFSLSFLGALGMVFWALCVLLALISSVFVILNVMILERVEPELTNFSWFITPVASIIVPLLGNTLISLYAGEHLGLAKGINLIDIAFLGNGSLLFIIFSGILFARFINHKMPHATVTPTFWILLGPVGVGTLSLMGIAEASRRLGLLQAVGPLNILALALWGFGLWAFILTIVVTIKYLLEGGIPFSLSWWAFIFPLAAYTLSSFRIYAFTGVKAVLWYAVGLAVLLTVLWISTFARSVISTVSGRLLVPAGAQHEARDGAQPLLVGRTKLQNRGEVTP